MMVMSNSMHDLEAVALATKAGGDGGWQAYEMEDLWELKAEGGGGGGGGVLLVEGFRGGSVISFSVVFRSRGGRGGGWKGAFAPPGGAIADEYGIVGGGGRGIYGLSYLRDWFCEAPLAYFRRRCVSSARTACP